MEIVDNLNEEVDPVYIKLGSKIEISKMRALFNHRAILKFFGVKNLNHILNKLGEYSGVDEYSILDKILQDYDKKNILKEEE